MVPELQISRWADLASEDQATKTKATPENNVVTEPPRWRLISADVETPRDQVTSEVHVAPEPTVTPASSESQS